MTSKQLNELSALVHEFCGGDIPKCPRSISTRRALQITATYFRTGRTQEDLAETFGTSQPTISRVINAVTTQGQFILGLSAWRGDDTPVRV